MGKKNKLLRFAQINSFKNVYQNFQYENPQLIGKDNVKTDLKGVWGSQHFKNDNPITLELACGGGEYTVALARKYPDRNFIGVDVKGARIYKGAKIALQEELDNAAFLRTRIEVIETFIAPEEITEIWITFPDPFLKERKSNKRLTAPPFFDRYKNILKKDHIIHLKTDSTPLYEFTLESIESYGAQLLFNNDDIYREETKFEELDFKTFYELKHLANDLKIKYIRFKL